MSKWFSRFSLGLTAGLSLIFNPALAQNCPIPELYLKHIESGSGVMPVTGIDLGLGEDACQLFEHSDPLKRKITCQWTNSDQRVWSADDAKDLGARLHRECRSLTSHFSDARHEGAVYFLWFGDFTGLTLDHSAKGITLTVQIDEEAYYFS